MLHRDVTMQECIMPITEIVLMQHTRRMVWSFYTLSFFVVTYSAT